MEALRKRARELLEGGTVKVVIGYADGSAKDRARAVFVRQPDRAAKLVFDDRCRQNLAVYLLKPEVKALGKSAIVAKPTTLRSILQLAGENQIADGQFLALAVADGQVAELATFEAIEKHLATTQRGLPASDREAVAKIAAMSREQRWQFWQNEFARCMKCYACRAACPMCYCTRCVVESNQPQWIPAAPTELGNLEWHIVRAMHLAGRCLNCGYCAEACPVGIKLNLLTQMLAEEIGKEFGSEAGFGVKREYALSMFKPDDKEDFIR
jgi:formate dehydrogenase subunit beta